MPCIASGMFKYLCCRISSRTSSWFLSVQPQTALEVDGGAARPRQTRKPQTPPPFPQSTPSPTPCRPTPPSFCSPPPAPPTNRFSPIPPPPLKSPAENKSTPATLSWVDVTEPT